MQDKLISALRESHSKNGALKLSLFRRINQLGTGDVGLVDLVELASDGSRSASAYLTCALQTVFCQHIAFVYTRRKH